MKLEKQVTSLKLSKKLKKLGVKQYSEFYWYFKVDTGWDVVQSVYAEDVFGTWYNDTPKVSAFTVAELGEMLPPQIKVEREYLNLTMTKWSNGKFGIGYSREDKYNDTEASARAKMLIYLIENNLK